MSQKKNSTENLFKNLQDFSSVLQDISLNYDTPVWTRRSKDPAQKCSLSPAESTRSSLGILPQEIMDNVSMAESMETSSLNFPRFGLLETDSGRGNLENIPPKFFQTRLELESGSLDEDDDIDVKNFLDTKDVRALDAMYTPSSTDTDEESPYRTETDDEPPSTQFVSSGEELAKPLPRSANQSSDKDMFIRPLPPSAAPTPRSFMRPKPSIYTPKGVPASLLQPNFSMNKTVDESPRIPPRAPVPWGPHFDSLLENSGAQLPGIENSITQQSFNGSGFPWERLIPEEKDMEESRFDEPLDPSFCSGKISARSTSLGPRSGIGDSTVDENFSDFSKPLSFQASYLSKYSDTHQDRDESVFHSGFPPARAVFNPFDLTDNNVQGQGVDFEQFQAGDKGLEDFLNLEEKECLQNHQFLEEEQMDEPHNASVLSGISDKSIVLRNNGLWAGNTSGVDLDKLREETRLSRCEYFRHNSSRLGSLEESIPETERPAFGFVHKIRSPEHKPHALLESSIASGSDSSNRLTYSVDCSNSQTVTKGNRHDHEAKNGRTNGESGGSGSVPSSADSSYIKSGESTKTVLSLELSGTLKPEELANRLETLSDQLGNPGGPNISYPDVVEASLSQDRELERSLQALVEGEINLSTISKALSDASLSSDPAHFVNLIRNLLEAKKPLNTVDEKGENVKDTKETKPNEPKPNVNRLDQNSVFSNNRSSSQTTEIITTPLSTMSQSVGKVRRNPTDFRTSRLRSDPESLSKIRSQSFWPPTNAAQMKHSSISEPPTPRDTPTPPLMKSSSVPYSLDVSRRRRPSGTRHSSPVKKSPKKVMLCADNTPNLGLDNLLQAAEITPSLFISSRKHLHTSTPFHPNLNLSTVVIDNLTRNKSISPFVNPDHTINPEDLDLSKVSPELYTGIQGPKSFNSGLLRGITPVGSQIKEPYFQKLHLKEDLNIEEIHCSHVWNKIQIPIIHNLTFDVQAVLKITKIWMGSLEIPEEHWTKVLIFDPETLLSVRPNTEVVEFSFFGKREGAFALNLGLISPGGLTSSGVVRFQLEEPNLRVLTRNGQTVDFGTVSICSRQHVPVMLVNCGASTLPIVLEIGSNSRIFSFSQNVVQKSTEFHIPGKIDAHTDEGVAKEVIIWADAGQVLEHSKSRVYTASLLVKLGDTSSQVELGRVDLVIRVCNSRITLNPKFEGFACLSGEKSVQTTNITLEGSISLDVEAFISDIQEGMFIFEKRFKLFPGTIKPFRIEYISKPGFSGKICGDLIFRIVSGGVLSQVPVQINVLLRSQTALFSETSPGLKLGVMNQEENRFPVDADRSLINWFAVGPGCMETQQMSLRNSSNSVVNLNVMIRDSDFFKVVNSTSFEVVTKLSFVPRETKLINIVFAPKASGDFTGKLVLKPLNMKIGGKIIKASIRLYGSAGSPDIKILDLKSTDDVSYVSVLNREPPTKKEFRIFNSGTTKGFAKIVCSPDLGMNASKVHISPDNFTLNKRESKTVTVSFEAGFEPSSAGVTVFLGPEIVRSVYRKAKSLPGAARLSASPELLGIDFSKNINPEDDYSGEITAEDVKHFFTKTEKHTINFQFPEKTAKFDELAVEETLSDTRLDVTALNHSPPTTDTVETKSFLHILPKTVSIDQGSEAIIKITNAESATVHWDLNWDSSYLTCSPPAGQLARGGQAIILVAAKKDCFISSQGWTGRVEIYSDHSVDYINVFIKPQEIPHHRLTVTPGFLDFGKVVVGCQDHRSLTLTNPSFELVQWRGVAQSPQFDLSQPSGLLNPGQSVNVALVFRPVGPGETRTNIHFTTLSAGKGASPSGLVVSAQLLGCGISLQREPTQLTSQRELQLMSQQGTSVPKIIDTPSTASSAGRTSIPSNNSGPRKPDSTPSQDIQPYQTGNWNLSATSISSGPPEGFNSQNSMSNLPVVSSQVGVRNSKGTLSLESENIAFDPTPIGRSQVLKITIKNRTGESQLVNLFLEPGSPFSIIHQQLEIKSQSFSRVPVRFNPSVPGRFGAHLRISTNSGWNLVATLSGRGTLDAPLNST